MNPGFSVDALVRAGRGGGALRMGLTRIAEADWLEPDFDRAARRDAFDAHPDAVQARPGSEAAQRELAALAGVDGGIAEAARATWEDLCLLERDTAGAHVLTAGAVAFPTDWHLTEKIGRALTPIHAPIHGYAEQLSAGVDHFLAALKPGPIFARANWFVVASDAWRYLPTDDPAARFAHVTADNAGATLFVRAERQTLRRLPATGAVVFTIGIAVAPLASLLRETVARIATGIASQSAGEQGRRAAPFYADALARYAASRRDGEADR